MKVAFVGKGGSGKTTLAELFARYLAASGATVLAFDADINEHLLDAVGGQADDSLVGFGHQKKSVAEFLRGSNPLIAPEDFIKTTPPGRGSRLVALHERSNVIFDCAQVVEPNLRVLTAGSFVLDQLGNACFHSLLHTLQALMSHLVHGKNEYFVVDMTAGADAFASGLFMQFDVIVLVMEPTKRSAGVYGQFKKYSAMLELELPLVVVGNKVKDASDVEFITQQAGDDLCALLQRSAYVEKAEKDAPGPFANLEEENLAALAVLQQVIDAMPKDWAVAQGVQEELHRLECTHDTDKPEKRKLLTQIDPEFSLQSAVSNMLAEKM